MTMFQKLKLILKSVRQYKKYALITPIFMIDKPFWMTIELVMAALIYLTWMHGIKPHNIWATDLVNVSIFTVVKQIISIIL